MKKLFAAVLILTSLNALATKARYKALNSSFHLVDTQSEFSSPYHLFSLKDFYSVESGLTAATSADNGAEALAKFSINDDSKMLIAVGHKDEAIQNQRKFMNAAAATAFSPQQNPVEVIYAVKADGVIWAGGVFFSKYKDKVTDNSEDSTGLRLAASHGDFKWKVNLGLVNKVQNVANGTFVNQPYTNVALRYGPGGNKFGLDYTTWNAKREVTGNEVNSYSYQNIKFQYVNTVAKDGEDFFYGIAVDSVTVNDKAKSKDFNRLALPVWMGLEHQAADWLVVRASIKQTIYAQSKDDASFPAGTNDGTNGAVTDFAAEPNNTEAAVGLGLRFNNVMIDGTLQGLTGASASQQVNTSTFFALAGLTYSY